MHTAGYRALGLPFVYVPFRVADLAGALRGMRALGIRGFGVSMPYKLEVIPLLDELSPVAARIGAVNTIVNTDGRLVGHNTDEGGALHALEEVRPLTGARALLVGAGGAARAIACGLVRRGVNLSIANRDRRKGAKLADEMGARSVDAQEVERAGDYDIVINATSVGMAEVDSASPIPEGAIRQGMVVMDIVYKPLETKLVTAARARGAKAIHGGRMLLHQAARQFELYTGRTAPLDVMDQALREAIALPPA
jgi:shikimate dehydrogenase